MEKPLSLNIKKRRRRPTLFLVGDINSNLLLVAKIGLNIRYTNKMQPIINNYEVSQQGQQNHLNKTTATAKYLAMVLFVVLPFVGGWIGYHYVPQNVIEIEKVVYKEIDPAINEEQKGNLDERVMTDVVNNALLDTFDTSLWQEYRSETLALSFKYPLTIDSEGDYPRTFYMDVVFDKPPIWEVREWSQYDIAIIEPFPLSDGPWSIRYVEMSNEEIEEEIAKTGDQFLDRKELRANVMVDGKLGQLITITTNENPQWINQTIFVNNNGKTLRVNNGSIGKEQYLKAFEIFYSSMRFESAGN